MKPAQTQRLVARSPMAEQLDREAWLAKRLGDHGVAEIFAGLTDPAVRRERVIRSLELRPH